MTSNELRAKYMQAYRIIKRERDMRDGVFRPGHPRRNEKLAEMDELLTILMELKDELKERLAEEEYEQPSLLDMPAKYD